MQMSAAQSMRTGLAVPPMLHAFAPTCALKDVEHVMYIKLGQPVGQHSSCQVGMAVVVKVFASQKCVYVWIASRSKKVVYTTAFTIFSVVCKAVTGDRDERPQERQDGPKPVKNCDVCGL